MEKKLGTIIETKGFEQLGILVLDGSGSMEDIGETGSSKAIEVNFAVQGFISRLRKSTNFQNFYLAMIIYDDHVEKRFGPKPVSQMTREDEMADYNPLASHGGETAIGDALEYAGNIAVEFLEEKTSFPRSAVIILMTDGCNTPGYKDPEEAANKIKNNGKDNKIFIAGYGKSDEIDSLTMQKIVSGQKSIKKSEKGYVRAYDPEQLRDFLTQSMKI